MPDDKKTKAASNAAQDVAVADSFPASDPPASTADSGARAVPPEQMMEQSHQEVPGAITLRRRFGDREAAKLAREAIVRDGPVDPHCAELKDAQGGCELIIKVPAADAPRLRELLGAN